MYPRCPAAVPTIESLESRSYLSASSPGAAIDDPIAAAATAHVAPQAAPRAAGLAHTTAALSTTRFGAYTTTVGARALFAGDLAVPDDTVDLYDAATGAWSAARLSQARWLMAAAVAGGQALFAGGDTADTDSVTSLVDVFTADDTRPTAGAADVPPLAVNRQLYTFSVTYHDEYGIDPTSLDDADIIVTGPGGFSAPAHMAFQARGRRSTTRFVVYTLQGPGRRWDASDNGTYTIHLQDGQVLDPSGNPATGRRLGSFTIAIPAPTAPPTFTQGGGTVRTRRPIDELLET